MGKYEPHMKYENNGGGNGRKAIFIKTMGDNSKTDQK